jgi:hypothetical protein
MAGVCEGSATNYSICDERCPKATVRKTILSRRVQVLKTSDPGIKQSFVSMFLGVSLPCFLGMMSRVTGVSTRGVRMMCRFFMVATSVVFGRLRVVPRRVGMML